MDSESAIKDIFTKKMPTFLRTNTQRAQYIRTGKRRKKNSTTLIPPHVNEFMVKNT